MTTFGDYTLPRLRVRLVTMSAMLLVSPSGGPASPRTGRVILLAGAGRGRRAPGRGVHPTPHSCTIYRTSTPTVANHGAARRGATSPVPLPERRFVTGRASRATPSWPPFLHRSDHRCPGLAGPRCCGARAVSADACDGASARPVPHAPSRRAPAGPATVRRVLMGSCRATAVTPCACRIAIGMARTARRSAFDVRSTL